MNNQQCFCRIANGIITLGNSRIRVDISAKTGGIVLLRNELTGSQYIALPHLASGFRLRYLLPGEMWVDAESSGQQLSRYNVSDEEGAGKCLRLEYDKVMLPGSRGMLGAVSVSITLKPDDEEAVWTIRVTNQGEGTIQEVWFPIVRGIRSVGPDSREDALIIPDRSGERIANPLNAFGHHGACIHIHYPKRASMQWMDLCDRSEGMYMVSYDKRLDCLTALHAEKEILDNEASLFMSFVMYPFVLPGGTWESAQLGLAVHRGDWHWGADRYRAWAETWIRRPEHPAWLIDSNGVAGVIAKLQNGPMHYRFSDIPPFFAQMKELGVNTLLLLGWSGNGFDTLYPEYIPIPEMGGEEELKAALAKVREMGGHTLLYIQYRLMDVYSHYYAEGGRDWAMKSATASPRPTLFVDIGERERIEEYRWPGRPRTAGKFALPCPYVEDWQKLLTEAAVKVVANLGADGIWFDQLCSTTALFCHDGSHGHATPASHWAEGHRKFLANLTRELKKVRGDFCIGGEGTNDILGEYVHIHSGTVGPVIGKSYPELFRYTFPWHRIMQMGNEEKELIHTFVTGRLLSADMQPEDSGRKKLPSEYMKLFRELADLKYAKRKYLTRGRFMDDAGLRILRNGDGEAEGGLDRSSCPKGSAGDAVNLVSEEEVLAKWHLGEDGTSALVCLWNRTDELRPIIISLETTKLVEIAPSKPACARYKVAVVHPKVMEIKGPGERDLWSGQDLETGVAFSLSGGQIAVLEIQQR